MKWKDLFKKKKPNEAEKINLDDDIYISDEMKTFNPEAENNDSLETTVLTQSTTNEAAKVIHENIMRQGVKDQLKAENIKVDFTPLTYNEIQKAAWMLQHANKVVISVSKMKPDDRSKTLNFFAGMIYALNGDVNHYSRDIYIFEISGKKN